jgi:hypothetical protein
MRSFQLQEAFHERAAPPVALPAGVIELLRRGFLLKLLSEVRLYAPQFSQVLGLGDRFRFLVVWQAAEVGQDVVKRPVLECPLASGKLLFRPGRAVTSEVVQEGAKVFLHLLR